MDPYAPEGVLPNVLRWLDRPGQAVRNVMAGRPGASLRQLIDFGGEAADAFLPGDWIPPVTSSADYTSASELTGAQGMPAWARTAIDIVGDTVTNPLSYLSFGAANAASGAGRHAIRAGIPFTEGAELATFAKPVDPLSLAMRGADRALTGAAGKIDSLTQSPSVTGAQRSSVSQSYQDAKDWTRRAAGADDLSAPVRGDLSQFTAEGAAASKLWTGKASQVMAGLQIDERVLLGQAFHGVDIGSLKPGAGQTASAMTGDLMQRVDQLARTHGKDSAKLRQVATDMVDLGRGQWDEGFSKGVYSNPTGRDDYLKREWLIPPDEFGNIPGTSKAVKETVLKTPQDVADFLNKGDVGLDLDAGRMMMDRASEQGRLLSRAGLARKQTGGTGSLDQGMLEQAHEAIKTTPNLTPDDRRMLTQMLNGMPPRGPITSVLAKLSRPVKGAMVYGVVLPKFGSLVRNKLGMGFQSLATPGVQGQALEHLNPAKIVRELGKAWDEAYGTSLFGKADDMTMDLAAIENAFKTAKNTDGVTAALRTAKRDDLADAVQGGVMDGFVSTEELVSKMARDPDMQKWLDIYRAPGVMFQALEQRGRLQTFKNLVQGGKTPPEAASLTKSAMFDYNISSPENRALRDVIPFGQFVVKAIPQQAKWISNTPAAGIAAAPLFYDPSGDQPPTLPWMQGRSRLAVGNDDSGNALYLTGFGLPMEALDSIPNLSADMREAGRDVSQGLLGSTQPVLKTLGAFATGKDPYFGTAFGSYDKLPIVGSAGEVGRAINMISGTGALDPLGISAVRQIGTAIDGTRPGVARALDLTTGAKLVSVDPDVAQQQVITRYLESRPDVQQYRTFYQNDKDPEFTELMAALRDAKKRAKERKEAAGQ